MVRHTLDQDQADRVLDAIGTTRRDVVDAFDRASTAAEQTTSELVTVGRRIADMEQTTLTIALCALAVALAALLLSGGKGRGR